MFAVMNGANAEDNTRFFIKYNIDNRNLFVKSQAKVLKKLKLSLTVHHQLLKKVLLQLKLKKSKLNLKKLELQLLLNNKVTTQVA